MEEVWKDIPGFEGYYKVSNNGKILSIKDCKSNQFKGERLISVHKNKKGYLRVVLWKDGKRYNLRCHRAVALAFIPNPNNYNQINHIDYDKTNNHVDNLEWCSNLQNQKHKWKRIYDVNRT